MSPFEQKYKFQRQIEIKGPQLVPREELSMVKRRVVRAKRGRESIHISQPMQIYTPHLAKKPHHTDRPVSKNLRPLPFNQYRDQFLQSNTDSGGADTLFAKDLSMTILQSDTNFSQSQQQLSSTPTVRNSLAAEQGNLSGIINQTISSIEITHKELPPISGRHQHRKHRRK